LAAFRAEPQRLGADRVLVEAAEREANRVELVARHREQEVRLVLAGVDAAVEAAVDDARVVAGDEHVGADRASALEERRELDVLVALHARVRRLAGEVRLDEIVDDRLAELGGEIDDVERDPEVRAHRACVLDVARAAAPAARRRRRAARVVEAHRHADDAVALLDEQCRGRRTIDTSRQRGDDERIVGTGSHGTW
jgi:hypothetical protein